MMRLLIIFKLQRWRHKHAVVWSDICIVRRRGHVKWLALYFCEHMHTVIDAFKVVAKEIHIALEW